MSRFGTPRLCPERLTGVEGRSSHVGNAAHSCPDIQAGMVAATLAWQLDACALIDITHLASVGCTRPAHGLHNMCLLLCLASWSSAYMAAVCGLMGGFGGLHTLPRTCAPGCSYSTVCLVSLLLTCWCKGCQAASWHHS